MGWKISRYLLANISPYFIFSWFLLSVVLFIQQASRYADIFFSVNIPASLVFQLSFALIPSVIAFTCPMAILVGTIIGLSKMQGDSELTAIRAAGVGTMQIALPVVLLGAGLSLFAFFVNLKGVPFASGLVRNVALRTALLKLESPIEPGVFNSEINGYTVYVRDGDVESGQWRNIFIYNNDRTGSATRLITASTGRIDSRTDETGETAELVLDDAMVTTIPAGAGRVVSETLGSFRFTIKTRRDEIIKRLTQSRETTEELGLSELAELARTAEGKERVEARILWQRRLLLSVTPLIFAFLGCALVLRFNRGGRGFGIFLALVSLVGFYLLTLIGEQLTRTGMIGAAIAGFLPVGASLIVAGWLFLSGTRGSLQLTATIRNAFASLTDRSEGRLSRENLYLDMTTGIRDFDIVANVVKYFALTSAFLAVIYIIFTAFELWKFAGAMTGGIALLVKYLIFLVPFLYLQLAPSALMIAILATFVIKSRANETVVWASSGQSVYRLMAPCFMLMAAVGAFNWGLQEFAAPYTNQMQDALRTQIRSRGSTANRDGKTWVARGNSIYQFDSPGFGVVWSDMVANPAVFSFDEGSHRLISISRGENARWSGGELTIANARITRFDGSSVTDSAVESVSIREADNPFANLSEKPSHMSSRETQRRLESADAESEVRALDTSLHKKRTTLVLPLLIALFTAPFAVSLSRRGKAASVGFAVVGWLTYLAAASAAEQTALSGSLAPAIAVWAPLLIFGASGLYLFSRIRT